MVMSENNTCPSCGAALPFDAPKGMCPRCLYRMGFGEARDEGRAAGPDFAGVPPVTPYASLPRSFGDYDLLEVIAEGGMGVVYMARQRNLDRLVAVKMIRAEHLARPQDVERFHREATAAARLQHPHIVAIHESGEIEGQHFYAMDYVAGRSLAAVVREHPLPPRRAAACVQTVAKAIHHAHQHGVLHRDLKPSNILIDADDAPHVTDFGLAKLLEGSADATMSGQVMGSPSYMAPEQAAGHGRTADVRTDIYALGAILYELVSGRPPFKADTVLETLKLVAEAEPVALRLLNPRLPRDLETICVKCLEKEPARRYTTAQILAEELGRFLDGKPVQARPVGTPAKAARWCRRNPRLACLTGGLVLVFALGLTGVLWQWRQAETARREAVENLWHSCLAQARANRWSERAGQRFDSLAALAQAAAIRPSRELRNEAIACLTLPDAQPLREWPLSPGHDFDFDAQLERYARAELDGEIVIGRVSDGAELLRLRATGHETPETVRLRFSPDGRLLAAKWYGRRTNHFQVWDLGRRKVVLQPPLAIHQFVVQFSPDSQRLAVAETNGTIHQYDLALGVELQTISVPQPPNEIHFDPQVTRLAVCSELDRVVRVFDLTSGELIQSLPHSSGIQALAWSQSGRQLACAGNDGCVYLWNMTTSKRLAVFEGHAGAVTGVLFNHQADLLVSAGWDGKTWFWDPILARPLFSLTGRYASAFNAEDTMLGFVRLTPYATAAGLWRVNSAPECRRLGRLGLAVPGNAAAFSPDQRLLAVAGREGVRVWNLVTGQTLGIVPAGDSRSAIFLPDGVLITSGIPGVKRWPLVWDSALETLDPGLPAVLWSGVAEHAALTPDGQRLVVVGLQSPDADALVIHLSDAAPLRRLKGHRPSTWVSISPDGRQFASGNWKGQSVCVRDLDSGQVITELPVGQNVNVAFSPDGQWLLTGSPSEYRFWNTRSWQAERSLPRELAGDYVGAMAFAPTGTLLAVVHQRDSQVKLYAVADGQELATLEAGIPLGFSPDGQRLVTLAEDERTLLLWDLALIRRQLATMNLDWH